MSRTIILLAILLLANCLAYETTKEIQDTFMQFYKNEIENNLLPEIDQRCNAACGEGWLKCIMEGDDCTSIEVDGCICDELLIEGLKGKKLNPASFIKGEMGIDLEAILKKDKMKYILGNAVASAIKRLEVEDLLEFSIEASSIAGETYGNNNCTVCIHRTTKKLDWQGRKNIEVCYLGIKGTSTLEEWTKYNFRIDPEDIEVGHGSGSLRFHKGFVDYVMNVKNDSRFIEFINDENCGARIIVGHSLGAAVAHILSAMFAKEIHGVYLFGLPNVMVAKAGNFKLPTTLSIMHSGDMIQIAPPSLTRIPSKNFTEYKASFEYKGKIGDLDAWQLLFVLGISINAIVFFRKHVILILLLTVVVILCFTIEQSSELLQEYLPKMNYKILLSLPGRGLLERRAMDQNHSMNHYRYSAMQIQLCGRDHTTKDYLKYKEQFDDLMKDESVRERDKAHRIQDLFVFGRSCS